jgi:hypothetical protein
MKYRERRMKSLQARIESAAQKAATAAELQGPGETGSSEISLPRRIREELFYVEGR